MYSYYLDFLKAKEPQKSWIWFQSVRLQTPALHAEHFELALTGDISSSF